MHEALRKSIENKGISESEYECEKVLGSSQKVNAFAQFYEEMEDSLAVVAADKLMSFYSGLDVTGMEGDAYKKAQKDIGMFFARCWQEREDKIKKMDEEEKLQKEAKKD